MKIVYLANIRFPTEKAHGLQIMKTCEALADKGAEVVLCVPRRRGAPAADPFEYYGVKRSFAIRLIPSMSFSFMRVERAAFILSQACFAAAALISVRMKSSDIVYARDEYSVALFSLFRRRVYFECHDGRFNFLARRALRTCYGIICVSRGLISAYSEKGIQAERMALIPNGADIGRFDPAMSRNEARAKLGLPFEGKIVLYTGHLYAWKGVDVLAEASAKLATKAKTIFVGGTDHDLAEFRYRWSGRPEISIIGRRPFSDIPVYLRAADVLVVPNSGKTGVSELYTSPIKLFEYMAAGKPIVASDLPSIRELLDGSNAVLVRPDDPIDLARGIDRALSDGGLAERIAARAKADARRYSWDERASKVLRFIETGSAKNPMRRERCFYDAESALYSKKRYPALSIDYVHFFYLRRLDIVKEFVRRTLTDAAHGTRPALLEVGCADGVVVGRIKDEFGPAFSAYRGIDVSPKMVDAARASHAGSGIAFEARYPEKCFGHGGESVILEVGVLNYTDIERELECAWSELPEGGAYICSIAGAGSLWDRHRTAETGFAHFKAYEAYERVLQQRFNVKSVRPVGLHIRGIWRSPAIARPLQSFVETILGPIAPGLFHEKVYLLIKRGVSR